MIELVLSVIFSALIILHITWIFLYLRPGKKADSGQAPAISVILPAHNEERFIKETLSSVLKARYPGKREIIVVNDGSTDATEEVVIAASKEDPRVRILNTEHAGKANAINMGIEKSTAPIIIALDADSQVSGDALIELVRPFTDERVGAVSGVIRAVSTGNVLTWFQDFEYVLSSGWRYLCNKINGTYILPGFLAVRKEAMEKIGGFSPDTFSEDFEIGIRLRKAGYVLSMTNATIYTRVPNTLRGLVKQRIRWGRGTLQVMRKHRDVILNREYGAIGLYGIPTQMYWYVHGMVYVPIFIYQVISGYFQYFGGLENPFTYEVAKYFIGWFSIYGMIDYSVKTFKGAYEIDVLFALLFTMFCLYILYNLLILLKFARPSIKHVFVIFFFFPYSLFVLSLQTYPILYELVMPTRSNVWEKSV
ncbi:MAG: glycosyltransferase family 2 protein [Candidatus Altiarchaeota archaeon]|nr:glycosyltransferase family 2 protein [Candidatus Altiarchaeota archaeon]